MSTFFTLLTERGEQTLANAIAQGKTVKLTALAVGDGNGQATTPDRKQTRLRNEKYRASINEITTDNNNHGTIIIEQVIPSQHGGFYIREIGVYDDNGHLFAVANCPESYKPKLAEGSGRDMVIRIMLVVNSTNNIELKIDPSVVLATRQYVDDQVDNVLLIMANAIINLQHHIITPYCK